MNPTAQQLVDAAREKMHRAPMRLHVDSPNGKHNEQPIPLILTEQANAQELVRINGEVIRYDVTRNAWRLYDGKRWPIDETGEVIRMAKRIARGFFAMLADPPAGVDTSKLFKHAKDSEKASGINATVALARTEPGIAVTAAQLDADNYAFNCNNGTLDLQAFDLRPHNPADLITRLAPVDYDENAKCPLWDCVLNRIMDGNASLIEYLKRLAGLWLTGDASVQELPIFFGGGGNGKNVFLDTIAGLMGDYACEAPPSLLTSGSHDQHPTEIADLDRKRLVIASETEEGAKLRIQLVKRLTGNAKLKARFMRQDFFEFPRTHKLVLVTNNRPLIRETTNAIWRRVRMVPFTVTIPPEEQDTHLLDKLREEWPGILAWAVRGCMEFQRAGMQTPPEVELATAEYRAEQDPLADFLADRCVRADNMMMVRAESYPAYLTWAKETGEPHPLERSVFYQHLRRVPGIEDTMARVNKHPTRVFKGVGLRSLANEYRAYQAKNGGVTG